MTRREVIFALAGGVVALRLSPLRAQQLRRIGLLRLAALPQIADFYAGLAETGYAEGRNLVIEDRFADRDYARLPDLAADLIRHNVDVIVAAGGSDAVRAAMRATATIPIVGSSVAPTPTPFSIVAHHNRPEGNVTGVAITTGDLAPKRLQILAEMTPGAVIGVLINPTYEMHERNRAMIEEAGRTLGATLIFAAASTDADLDAAFASLAGQQVGAILVEAEPFLGSNWRRLVSLAESHKIPMMQEWREAVLAGGLISYAPSLSWVYRQVGRYTGQLLNGSKVADLPVVAPDKIELAINLKTARALGLTVPQSLLARADEVIE
jgi:putative ABC transport system substrate-binding protein